jgi:Fic family protein
MQDLPIYPEKREAPEYALERRLGRLHERPEETYRAALDALRLRCARETLRLTGARSEAEDATSELVKAQLEALEVIETAAAQAGDPDVALIRKVHRIASPGSDGSFRSSAIEPHFKNARPSPPEFIGAKLDNLLDWLSGVSGREMFCAARMSLWFARFVEIAPFERGNFRTAHLFTGFFAVSAGFPPISLALEDADAVRSEIERAIRFDTAGLVTRFSGALSHALRECEEAAERATATATG